MFTELSNKIMALSEDISEMSKLINEFSVRLNGELERKNNYVQVIDDLKHLTKEDFDEMDEYLTDNVTEDDKEFVLTLPYNEDRDEFDFYVDDFGDLTVNTSGRWQNSTYSTTQTVTIPEDCDVDKLRHDVKDGNLIITVPKKEKKKTVFKKRRPTDFNYLHQKRDKKGRFVLMH